MDFTAKDFIISENEDFALVNKPVGMDSERAPGEGFFPVHRLDKVASGLLLYAKNPRSAKKLSESLQEGKIKKRYHIIVESAGDTSKEDDEALSVKTNSTKNTGSSTAKRLPKEDSSEAKRLPKEGSSEAKQLPKEGSFSDYLYKDTKKQKMFPVKKLKFEHSSQPTAFPSSETENTVPVRRGMLPCIAIPSPSRIQKAEKNCILQFRTGTKSPGGNS